MHGDDNTWRGVFWAQGDSTSLPCSSLAFVSSPWSCIRRVSLPEPRRQKAGIRRETPCYEIQKKRISEKHSLLRARGFLFQKIPVVKFSPLLTGLKCIHTVHISDLIPMFRGTLCDDILNQNSRIHHSVTEEGSLSFFWTIKPS